MEAVEPELIDVAPGLWLWQVQYREWPPDEGWDGRLFPPAWSQAAKLLFLIR
jgi:hypothetical protein